MHVYNTLAEAASSSGTANFPLILALAGLVLSLVAISKVSALRQELNSKPTPSSTPQPASAPAQAAKAPAAAQPAATAGIPPEIVAVIAAAVATVAGKSHRIVSIKPMSTSWERAGRQSVLTSHRIR